MIRVSVPNASDRDHADWPTTQPQPPAGMAIALTASEVRLVGFDGACEGNASTLPGLAEPVGQVPGSFLGHTKVAVQLHAGHAFEARGEEVDRHGPGLVAEIGGLHDRPGPNAEPTPAISAAVRHGLVRCVALDVRRATARAVGFIGPTLLCEPLFGGLVVREHGEQSRESESCSVVFAGCCHAGLPSW